MAKVKQAKTRSARLLRRVLGSRTSFAEQGQTVTEYAVVLAVLIIALTGVVFVLQAQIDTFIEKVAGAIAVLLP